MLVLLLLTALFVLACAVLGQGALALFGWKGWRWWSPTLGLALLTFAGGQLHLLPGRSAGAALGIGIFILAAAAIPATWRALRESLPASVGFVVVVLLLAAIPMFAFGFVGVYGPGVSDDMAQHLAGAWFLRLHYNIPPVAAIGGALSPAGYPLGPHGLVAAMVKVFGSDEIHAFDVITLAVPVLTAMAAFGALPARPRAGRAVVAVVLGLGYLPAAFLIQGQFKETMLALYLLAGAVILDEIVRGRRPSGPWRALGLGVPYGLIVAGGVYDYSYAALLWMGGAAGFVAFLEVVRRPRAIPATLKAGALPAVGLLLATAAAVSTEIPRMVDFANSIFGREPHKNHGNLFHALNPLEATGLWLSGDFRRQAYPLWPSVVLQALAVLALLGGLVWWVRRRRVALPATAIVAVVVWADLSVTRNIYNASKGLVVAAPVVMLCLAAPLLDAWAARAGGRLRLPALRAFRVAGAVLLAGAAISSLGLLRSGIVGIGQQDEFAKLRGAVGTGTTLFLGSDHFTEWDLRGARIASVSPLYIPFFLPMRQLKTGGTAFDADNYAPRELDQVDWLVTTNAPYQSDPPANFRLTERTRSFNLYRRVGLTPNRVPAEPPSQPYAELDCANPVLKAELPTHPYARVVPAPVIGPPWLGSMSVFGHTAHMRVRLPAGRWDVSLQYLAPTGAVVRGPGLRYELPRYTGRPSAYWYGGTLSSRGGVVALSITSNKRTWFGQLMGRGRAIRTSGTPDSEPLGAIAFTRHGAKGRIIPTAQACGRWTDWLGAKPDVGSPVSPGPAPQ